MPLRLRYLDAVDPRLKSEMSAYARWLRRWYEFPVPLEVRLIGCGSLIDDDGAECFLRWWQHGDGRPVTVEIAVGNFARNLAEHGAEVAYPTVAAAIARGLKYSFQAARDAPIREDHAERWGDRVMAAYVDEVTPPEPWAGAWRG